MKVLFGTHTWQSDYIASCFLHLSKIKGKDVETKTECLECMACMDGDVFKRPDFVFTVNLLHVSCNFHLVICDDCFQLDIN